MAKIDKSKMKCNKPKRQISGESFCMLISAYIRFRRRFSSAMAFITDTIDASIPPYLERHL